MALPSGSPGEKLQFCSCNTRSRLENLDLRHRAQRERESKRASEQAPWIGLLATAVLQQGEREMKKQVIATPGTRFCQITCQAFRNLSGARGLWVALAKAMTRKVARAVPTGRRWGVGVGARGCGATVEG